MGKPRPKAWWITTGIEGASFEIPDVDTGDSQPLHISSHELAEFYRQFQERFGVAYIDASYKVLLLSEQKMSLHIDVARKDEFTYILTVHARRFNP